LKHIFLSQYAFSLESCKLAARSQIVLNRKTIPTDMPGKIKSGLIQMSLPLSEGQDHTTGHFLFHATPQRSQRSTFRLFSAKKQASLQCCVRNVQ
jgi:hypothetical protein